MRHFLLIGITAAGLALGSICSAAPDHVPVLIPAWRDNPVDQPIELGIVVSRRTQNISLVLMDAEGNLQTEPVKPELTYEGGEDGDDAMLGSMAIDLAELMPDVWRLRQAGFLQLHVDDEPVGAALVLRPLLARLIPETEEALSPGGYTFTKIVGWRDENGTEVASAPVAPADPWLANQTLGERLFTGLRIYPEQDVVMQTSLGEITFAMRPDAAPNTVWNFLDLCTAGFYRGVVFHRVVPFSRDGDPFVIQAGDPTGSGSGGPGYWLPIEPSDLPHDFGVISMARDVPPDSAGSQFFVCLSREGTARLDGHYTAFGYAISGEETIRRIAAVELADTAAGRPRNPPVIESTHLVPAPSRRLGIGRPEKSLSTIAPPVDESGRVPR